MLVAKAYKYFIIFFILNPLFIQFSLSPSLSLSLLGFGDLGVSKNISIRENDYKEMGMRKPSVIGEFMVLLFLRSTFDRQKLPKHQIPKNPKPRPVDFFGSLFGFSLTGLSLSLFSLTGCHGRTSHGQPPSKSFHCNSISLSRRWIVVNWWGLILVSGFVDWFICGFVMELGLWIVAYELWIWFYCFNVVEGGWRVVVADENGLDWFRLPFGCFREYNKK